MAAEFQKCFNDSNVSFVDGNVQSRLAAFVAGIQIGTGVSQQFHDGRFVSKRRMVDGSVAIFVLQFKKIGLEQNLGSSVTNENEWAPGQQRVPMIVSVGPFRMAVKSAHVSNKLLMAASLYYTGPHQSKFHYGRGDGGLISIPLKTSTNLMTFKASRRHNEDGATVWVQQRRPAR